MLVTLDSFLTETSMSSSSALSSSSTFPLSGLNLFLAESLIGLILGTILTDWVVVGDGVVALEVVVEGDLVVVTSLLLSLNVFLLLKALNLVLELASLSLSLLLPGRPVLYLLGFLFLFWNKLRILLLSLMAGVDVSMTGSSVVGEGTD